MKIGDKVKHKTKNITGIVLSLGQRNSGVLIDESDNSGVRCREYHRNSLYVIEIEKD
tara:strand:+ start:891 stop:1061 length:171 start_codon:yes stop_codon:yes gene_type:complete